MKINNDINSLSPTFRKKFDPRRKEVKEKYPHAHVFETRRSKERQKRLYEESDRREKKWLPRLTRTMESNHFYWNAVDIVFNDSKGNPTRSWPYDDLIEIAKRYWIRNLKPRETCHFEDNWKNFTQKNTMTQRELRMLIISTMNDCSILYNYVDNTEGIDIDKTEKAKEYFNKINELFRSLWIDNK